MLAPIILFVYNRPWHTRQTLEALTRNYLADLSELFIYSDGPKSNASQEDILRIDEVRKIVREKQWCKENHIFESETNKGLADSIINGVTEIVNRYGKIIVLEDDIVTSTGFLSYMNDALQVYQHKEQVMHISGYMYPVEIELPQTYFFNTASCWGWATWERAWKKFNTDTISLLKQIHSKRQIKKFNIENGYDFYDQLKANADGRLNTWAIKWYSTIFLNKGYSLHPYPSLVTNIGNDGKGEHCSISDSYNWKLLPDSIIVKEIRIHESKLARKAFKEFFMKVNGEEKHIYIYKRFLKYWRRKIIPLQIRNIYHNYITKNQLKEKTQNYDDLN